MAIVITITKIDGKNFNGQDPVEIFGSGTWLVEGTATSSGGPIVSLAWNYSLFGSDRDIDLSNLPNWSFSLTSDAVGPLSGSTSSFWVQGHDDSNPPVNGGPTFGYVLWSEVRPQPAPPLPRV